MPTVGVLDTVGTNTSPERLSQLPWLPSPAVTPETGRKAALVSSRETSGGGEPELLEAGTCQSCSPVSCSPESRTEPGTH